MKRNPSQAQPRTMGPAPWKDSTLRNEGEEVEVEEEKVDTISSTETPGDSFQISPEAIPEPATPSLLVQVPSPLQPSARHPAPDCSRGGSKQV